MAASSRKRHRHSAKQTRSLSVRISLRQIYVDTQMSHPQRSCRSVTCKIHGRHSGGKAHCVRSLSIPINAWSVMSIAECSNTKETVSNYTDDGTDDIRFAKQRILLRASLSRISPCSLSVTLRAISLCKRQAISLSCSMPKNTAVDDERRRNGRPARRWPFVECRLDVKI